MERLDPREPEQLSDSDWRQFSMIRFNPSASTAMTSARIHAEDSADYLAVVMYIAERNRTD